MPDADVSLKRTTIGLRWASRSGNLLKAGRTLFCLETRQKEVGTLPTMCLTWGMRSRSGTSIQEATQMAGRSTRIHLVPLGDGEMEMSLNATASQDKPFLSASSIS